jgi:uncharacterized membrane protein
MKRNLFLIAMVVTAVPVFAQPIGSIAAAIPEPSIISLITAGIVALSIARRKTEKTTKL